MELCGEINDSQAIYCTFFFRIFAFILPQVQKPIKLVFEQL